MLKGLNSLPSEELTSKIICLFQEMLRVHDRGKGYVPFTWQDVRVYPEGDLSLRDVALEALDDDIVECNYRDFAGVVYCISTGRKSAESMGWDTERVITQPVLREMVLTLTGHNYTPDILVEKLRQPYQGELNFFKNLLRLMIRRQQMRNARRNKYGTKRGPGILQVCRMMMVLSVNGGLR
ncbi:MAG: hypothetical protein K2M79_05510 [Muribaculaceae bacterium]|nr:hypothetical protein [Muribaculaceae bacterium]